MGGPEMAPHTPRTLVAPRRSRGAPRSPTLVAPGEAVARLDPPTLVAPRRKPWRASTPRRSSRAGGTVALLDFARPQPRATPLRQRSTSATTAVGTVSQRTPGETLLARSIAMTAAPPAAAAHSTTVAATSSTRP